MNEYNNDNNNDNPADKRSGPPHFGRDFLILSQYYKPSFIKMHLILILIDLEVTNIQQFAGKNYKFRPYWHRVKSFLKSHLNSSHIKYVGQFKISCKRVEILHTNYWFGSRKTEDGTSMSLCLLYGQLSQGRMADFPAFIASKSFDL